MPDSPSYPGVYIDEIPSGARDITSVATSITAFLGRALRGPVNEPTRVRSFAEFERSFGGLWQSSTMSYAVQHYFLNGGTDALIVRLVNGTERAAFVLPPGDRQRRLGREDARGRGPARVTVEVRQRAAARSLCRREPVPRHQVGGVRAERRANVGPDPPRRRGVHAPPVPAGRVPRHDAARGLLRQVRRRDDHSERERPWDHERRRRLRPAQTSRVRPDQDSADRRPVCSLRETAPDPLPNPLTPAWRRCGSPW